MTIIDGALRIPYDELMRAHLKTCVQRDQAVAQRDQARRIAVDLEQQNAAALALHTPNDLGTGEPHAVALCPTCTSPAPCPTARALTSINDEETP